jgi:hypothetical protein
MPERFPLDESHIAAAHTVVARPGLYWLLGGSASGKSTVAALLAQTAGLPHIDVDTLIYDRFMPRYTPQQHPASCAWFHAANPLAWVLDLDWPAFNALTRAADAEALALLAADPALLPATPCLLDGGFAHPAVVAAAAGPARMVCLAAPAAERRAAWETDPGRAEMRAWIHALPDPEEKWRRFLAFDARQAETMLAECRGAGVPIVQRAPGESVAHTAARVAALLSLTIR